MTQHGGRPGGTSVALPGGDSAGGQQPLLPPAAGAVLAAAGQGCHQGIQVLGWWLHAFPELLAGHHFQRCWS